MTRLFTLFTAAAVLLLVMAWCTPVYSQEPLPEWVEIIEPSSCSVDCWELQSIEYRDASESGGLHHVFIKTFDENGNQIGDIEWSVEYGSTVETFQTKQPPDYSDFPMFACFSPSEGERGAYSVYVENSQNSPQVTGLGLPECQHESIYLEYIRKPASPPFQLFLSSIWRE